MDNTKTIHFNDRKYRILKRSYSKAHNAGKESFKFEDTELLTSYAKYLIEYLAHRFEKAN